MIDKTKKIIIKIIQNYLVKKCKKFAVIGRNFEVVLWPSIVNESKNKSAVKIGDNTILGGRLMVSPSGSIKVGSYCYIASNAFVGSACSVDIGDYVGIASNTHVIDNNNHPTEPNARREHRIRVAPKGQGYSSPCAAWDISDKSAIKIKDNVWIGMNCFVGKGVTIGEGAIIARNTVVTKSVPDYAVVAGNPGRVVKYIYPQ